MSTSDPQASELQAIAATALPRIDVAPPGPRSCALAERLSHVESRNVTALVPELPIFWQRASGANVWDVDGNRYVDLAGAFGVANAGHSHPHVTAAVARQSAELLHGMGDVHPSAVKVELLEALCARYPGGGEARGVLVSSGSDAVETALKTALLATGRAGVIAFEGGYHGLSLGSLDVTWRNDFREPFLERISHCTVHVQYGDIAAVAEVSSEIGAVIVEPIQGRGGERVPPEGFLRALRRLCDERGWLLIADEVYTGFGRTGAWFACEHEDVVPDLLCVGKGLSSGMPLSACLGTREAMDAWPASRGEALHTQTFLGHPASCAAALASIEVIEQAALVERSAELGAWFIEHLRKQLAGRSGVAEVRGRGLMIGIECRAPELALSACAEALRQGYILLPSGEGGSVLSLTPPLVIDRPTLEAAAQVLAACLA